MTYTTIDREATALGELGLHYHEVAKGEYAELDPDPRPSRKKKYVQYEIVEAVIGAYAEDLQKAYQSNESMEAVLEKQTEELKDFHNKFERAQKQLNEMMQAQEKFAVVEGMMATMEQQMQMFENDKEANEKVIGNLRKQLAEMETQTQAIDEMREDIEQILTNLSSYFVEEGFPSLEEVAADMEE